MLASGLMTKPPDEDPLVQLNVRVPQSLRTAIEERRQSRDMSLARWVENACRFALLQHGVTRTPTGNTATPPHRRGANL